MITNLIHEYYPGGKDNCAADGAVADVASTVKIYPDSAHGFLFQHHAEFAADVEAFLAKPD